MEQLIVDQTFPSILVTVYTIERAPVFSVTSAPLEQVQQTSYPCS